MRWLLAFIIAALLPAQITLPSYRGVLATASCCTYYVSQSTGSDSNPGTLAQPFQTLGHATAAMSTGNSLGLRSGDRWEETLTVPASNTSFAAYGTGAKPEIDAANFTTWTQGAGTPSSDCGTGTSVFCSGFESGNTAWTGTVLTDSPTISQTETTQVAHGSRGMSYTADANDRGGLYETYSAFTAGSTKYFRVYMYTPSGSMRASSGMIPMGLTTGASTSLNVWLQLNTNSSGNIVSVQLNGNTGYGNTLVASTAITWTMGAWNYIEFSYTVGTTTSNGGGQVWVNGVSVGSSTTANTTSGTAFTSVLLGNGYFAGGPAAGQTVYFDDFRLQATGPIGAFSATGIPSTVWYTSRATDALFPVFGNTPGVPVGSIGSVVSANQYYWDGSAFLYVYGPGDPTSTVEIPARDSAITLTNKSHVSFNGLAWRGSTGNGGFNATTGNQYVSITNCLAELNYQDGIWFYDNVNPQNYNSVIGSTVRNNGSTGIDINSDLHSNITIANNTVYQNGLVGIGSGTAYTAGIKMFSYSGNGGANSVISGNTVYSNGGSGATSANGVGIWMDSPTGVTLSNNTIYGNASNGMFLEKTTNCTATYNVLYNNAQFAQFTANMAVYASGTGGGGSDAANTSSGNLIANNTLYNSGWWGMQLGVYTGFGAAFFSSNTVQNNIILGAAHETIYFDYGANNNTTNGSGNVYTHNSLGAQSANFVNWVPGGDLGTYAALDSAYGSAMNNLTVDPQMVSPGTGNFALQVGSPAIGAGVGGLNIGAK